MRGKGGGLVLGTQGFTPAIPYRQVVSTGHLQQYCQGQEYKSYLSHIETKIPAITAVAARDPSEN